MNELTINISSNYLISPYFKSEIYGYNRYYTGVAHPGEFVVLVREPRNP